MLENGKFKVRAYCMESEEDIKVYESEWHELKREVDESTLQVEWRSDGRAVLTVRKQDAPSFWKYLLSDPIKEAKELQVWWDMRDKYIEVLEEYMIEENIKERKEKAGGDL